MNVTSHGHERPRKAHPVLSVVVPIYNEEAVIALTHAELVRVLGGRSDFGLEIVYVDDGSRDATPSIVQGLTVHDPRAVLVCLARNFGHQAAVTAGLACARGDVVAVIDGDLQDPPEAILGMIDKWREGWDVVYGVRTRRKEPLFYRLAYASFYRILNALSDVHIPLDSGDFSLMDRRIVDILNQLPEKNRFIRGLRAWSGFRQTGHAYERHARAAGESKYSLSKLFTLAADGLLNFSTRPLSFLFVAGLAAASLALVASAVLLAQRMFHFSIFGFGYQDAPGMTTTLLVPLFFSGLQLAAIGVIGAYIGRLYQETKNRPAFIIGAVFREGKPQPGTPGKTAPPTQTQS